MIKTNLIIDPIGFTFYMLESKNEDRGYLINQFLSNVFIRPTDQAI